MDDNRESAVIAAGHCARFFRDRRYARPGHQAAVRPPRGPARVAARGGLVDARLPAERAHALPAPGAVGAGARWPAPSNASPTTGPAAFPPPAAAGCSPGTRALADLIARALAHRLAAARLLLRGGRRRAGRRARARAARSTGAWTPARPTTGRSATRSCAGCWPTTAPATAMPAPGAWACRRSPGTAASGPRRAGAPACARSEAATAAATGSTSRSRARVRRGPLAGGADQPLELVRRPLHQLAHLVVRLAEAAQHVRGDDLGVGRVRAPHTHPDAVEVRAAQPRLSDLRPLWPARPPPRRLSMRPNGRSISSCTATTRSSGTPSAPRAGLTALPDSFM